MGWVTLTVRKQSLKRQHNDYELQLLEISHSRRQLSRGKQSELSLMNYDKQTEIENLKDSTGYNEYKEEYQQALKDGDKESVSEAAQAYSAAKADFDEQKEYVTQYYDNESEELESETTERENDLDEEQTQIEAIIESISQEIESVGQQISSDIQGSTIQLK